MFYISVFVAVTCVCSLWDMSSCCHLWLVLSSLCVSYVNTRKSSRNRGETTYNIEEELTETQFGLEIPYCASKIAKARKNSYFWWLIWRETWADETRGSLSSYLSFLSLICMCCCRNVVLLQSAALFQTLLRLLCKVWRMNSEALGAQSFRYGIARG